MTEKQTFLLKTHELIISVSDVRKLNAVLSNLDEVFFNSNSVEISLLNFIKTCNF